MSDNYDYHYISTVKMMLTSLLCNLSETYLRANPANSNPTPDSQKNGLAKRSGCIILFKFDFQCSRFLKL